jgi:amidophosphoribosyltransferase
MKRLVSALRHYGAKEIHLRSSSPPLRYPCYFGIDIPKEKELIAAGRTVEEIREYIGVDSIGYLSMPGLGRAISTSMSGAEGPNDEQALSMLHSEFCYGCMQTQGWPFDPKVEAKHGAQLINLMPRRVAVKGQ